MTDDELRQHYLKLKAAMVPPVTAPPKCHGFPMVLHTVGWGYSTWYCPTCAALTTTP